MTPSFLSYFSKHASQVFHYWSQLTQKEQYALIRQLHYIKIDILKKQQQLILESDSSGSITFEPFNDFAFSGNLENQMKGQELIGKGRLGCILLAGGQGTRLQHKGPKGTYPISVIKNKTLFQLCAEKVRAASLRAGHPLSLAIMTAPDNDKETRSFFDSHAFFGLDPSQVSFFVQEKLPLLDDKGALFLQTPSQIAEGSDGNGHSLLCFAQSGILDQWVKSGIEFIHIILIDNPLADPFDAELLGFHHAQNNEISLKSTEKIDPNEKVGLLVKQNGHCRVIEYTEMNDQEKMARRSDGRLKHCCANLSLFCFSISFIQRMVKTGQFLPLHKAWKASSYIDVNGKTQPSSRPNAWKFETFIFDWLVYTQKVSALIYPREECFAPLKNVTGADSPKTVQSAIQKKERILIEKITGIQIPDVAFELAPEFYYPSPELLEKWKGKKIFSGYIRSFP